MTGPAPGYFTVISQTQPDKLGEVVARIRARTSSGPRQARSPRRSSARPIEQIVALHAQENTTIAGQARQAALDELYGLGYDYDKSFDQRIQAVTMDDVVRVAQVPGQVAPCDLLAGSGMIASAPGGIGRASGERTKMGQ